MIIARIELWGTLLALVSKDDHEPFVRFQYNHDFLKSGIQPAPLMMPLSEQVYSFPALATDSFQGLPGLLADALPDKFGESLFQNWLAQQGRNPLSFNAIEKLLYIGTRGMGALVFKPAMPEKIKGDRVIRINDLMRLANKILNEREKVSNRGRTIKELMLVGTSAGGMRPKAIVAYNGEIFRSGQVDHDPSFTYWIIKFDDQSSKEYTKIEYAYYLMARDCGIHMSESRLLKKSGSTHFMTKRFDRQVDEQGKVLRLHMQSLAALTHVDFRAIGASSYEYAAQVINRLAITGDAKEQLFRRMVFNVLAINHDDHPKNISFLMNKQGTWSLSPAYDMTFAYNPEGAWTKTHQMSVNGKLEGITINDLLAAGSKFDLTKGTMITIINQIRTIVENCDRYAQRVGIAKVNWEFASQTIKSKLQAIEK